MAKLRFKLTYEGEYEADPRHYDTDDLAAMAEVDRKSIEADPEEWLLWCEHVDKTTVEVFPVEEA